ncbi:MAG TPA: Na(+)/H(+) antiporter subunit D [Clostridiales bacterium UBA8153]|nr:Na(+)/H(+) antiporter subunit D [Clostridiales bacterium UBA8153]
MHPALIFFAGAVLVPLVKGRSQKALIVLVPLAALAGSLLTRTRVEWLFPFLGFVVTPFHADRLSLFVERIFLLSALLIILYSLHVEEDAHHIASFLYIGSSLGVVFAGDFVAFFVFWKLLSIVPAVLIWLKRDQASLKAGFAYLAMHLTGGGIMLVGILLHFSATGSMELTGLAGIPLALVLTGVGFKAAFIPVHTWLPDAYPKASYTASVFLSAFTTKAAVYALARLFSGVGAVAYMGGVMGLYGVIWALRQSDGRKLLSYHIISQVGYMVAAIGIGTRLGVDAGLSHVWNHILYKALLFMCMGAVIYRTGRQDLSELGGLLRKMPITTATCVIAALSISGVPLFNGFVSKAMIYEATGGQAVLYWMLKLTSAGTFLSFCKFTYFGFLRKKEIQAREAPATMTIPMVIMASLCILGGLYPALLTGILPHQNRLSVFTPEKLLDSLVVFGAGGLAFRLGVKVLEPHPRETRDFDYLYLAMARGFLWFWRNPSVALASLADAAGAKVLRVLAVSVGFLGTLLSPVPPAAVDRWRLRAEQAAGRGQERRMLVTYGPPRVEVRSMEAALFLVAAMLSLLLLYVAMGHLTHVSPWLPAALP